MEIKKKGKVKEFFKKFGLAIGCGVIVLALTVTGLVIGLTTNNSTTVLPPDDDQQVSTGELKFSLPMTNPEVIKDFYAKDLK